jgi:hypothetical protein
VPEEEVWARNQYCAWERLLHLATSLKPCMLLSAVREEHLPRPPCPCGQWGRPWGPAGQWQAGSTCPRGPSQPARTDEPRVSPLAGAILYYTSSLSSELHVQEA